MDLHQSIYYAIGLYVIQFNRIIVYVSLNVCVMYLNTEMRDVAVRRELLSHQSILLPENAHTMHLAISTIVDCFVFEPKCVGRLNDRFAQLCT